jgi:hypothetical protein
VKHYILDHNGEPVPCDDVLEWAKWFGQNTARRIVAQDHAGVVGVSTVFLGLDHSWTDGPPLLYETMVFGGPLTGEQQRYSTREQALRGHQEMFERVTNSVH